MKIFYGLFFFHIIAYSLGPIGIINKSYKPITVRYYFEKKNMKEVVLPADQLLGLYQKPQTAEEEFELVHVPTITMKNDKGAFVDITAQILKEISRCSDRGSAGALVEIRPQEKNKCEICLSVCVKDYLIKWPLFFSGLMDMPVEYFLKYIYALSRIKEDYLKEKHTRKPNETENKFAARVNEFIWSELARVFNFTQIFFDVNESFVFNSDGRYIKGYLDHYTVLEYEKEIKNNPAAQQSAAKKLVGRYKIHLMPENKNGAVWRMLYALTVDPELSNGITAFKIRREPPAKIDGLWLPIVVIYPIEGKDSAQKVLNKIYAIFKDYPAIKPTMAPRYNARVNDLIWAAQGDGDYKYNKYKELYEEPLRIYYRNDLTGKIENYYLVDPATGKELVS